MTEKNPPAAHVPTVDFEPFLKDEGILVGEAPTAGQLAVAHAIDLACREHGFLYLVNFGLSADDRRKAFDAAHELFELDTTTKLEGLRRLGKTDNMGYAPYKYESHNPRRPPELSEKFGVRFPPTHTNDFSACPPAFVESCQRLRTVMKDACYRYCLALALALGVHTQQPKLFADTFTVMNQCTLRFLHAPPCDYEQTAEENLDQSIRVSEHTDFGLITFLLHDDHGPEGLQIRPVEGGEVEHKEADGVWHNVVVPTVSGNTAGALVNTGALLARWSNDEWKATAHRVVVQSAEQATRDRYSLAFFADPDVGSVVDVPDELLDRTGKSKLYQPTTSDAYLLEKLRAMGRGENAVGTGNEEKREHPSATAPPLSSEWTSTSKDFVPRYRGPTDDEMTSEQVSIRDSILASRPGTGLNGPFGPWLAVPAIAQPAQSLGRACRYGTTLSRQESELVILLTGARFRSHTEFDIHVGEALKAGISLAVIQAIPRDDAFSLAAVQNELIPILADRTREQSIVQFTAELLETSKVSDETYQRTKLAVDGKDSVLVEITSIIGYYSFVSYTLNVFQLPS